MSTSIYILLIVASSTIITTYSRSLSNPEQLMPLLLTSLADEDNDANSSSPNGQNRFLYVVKYIIKYVSRIRSHENFIDDIINRQKQVAHKIKILKFLNKCFQITNSVVQHEIHRILKMSDTNKKPLFSLSLALEELQQAQNDIDNLLQIIQERMVVLKTWIPPTIPFLGF